MPPKSKCSSSGQTGVECLNKTDLDAHDTQIGRIRGKLKILAQSQGAQMKLSQMVSHEKIS
ncbi:hypothetical protein DPMN_153852 [Dreissena polymorpha]|uniref:Uncharacterized protein n=1 Tax=Dreissena polymorpha TaxID=45954 RepID=A0A9D4FQN9_DREPO|nr:hypothetical protein DPMN_153852 [Dreissena polymorpha]